MLLKTLQNLSMVCREQKVKFWQVLDTTTHILLGEDFCMEPRDNIYIEYADGTKEFLDKALFKETLWNWDRMPEYEHPNIVQLLNNVDVKALVMLANKYNIAGYTLCCNTDFIIKQYKLYARGIKA